MAIRTSQGFTQTRNPFGQAQPQQGPSFGTAYNPQQGSNFSMPAWAQNAPVARPQQGGTQQGYRGMQQPAGGQWSAGPIQGSVIYRPPVNQGGPVRLAPPAPPPPGAMGPAAPRPKDTVRRSVMPHQQPKASAPGMPLGMPASMRPHLEEARQMFPELSSHQQQEMAWKLANQQQINSQNVMQRAEQAAMGQWQADQSAAGQNLNPRNPYQSEGERASAQQAIMRAQQQRQQRQRQQWAAAQRR